MMEPKIGIIVPFFNGHKYLDRLIESFDRAAEGLNCTLYIIDNSPAGEVVEMKFTCRIPVEVIREKAAIGYGRACNRGYAICKELGYDYIIIANQDGYVSKNFIFLGSLTTLSGRRKDINGCPFVKDLPKQ